MNNPLHSRQRTTLLLVVLCAFLAIVYLGKYLYEIAYDGNFTYGDFKVFYLAAERVASGQYDALYTADNMSVIAGSPGNEREINKAFIYPPVFASLLGLLGSLPLNMAYMLWLVTIGGFYLLVLHRCWRSAVERMHADRDGRIIYALMLLASPLLYTSLFAAQVAGLVSGLLLLGLYFLPRRKFVAGMCFGLMCIKPQFALLAGIMLLMRGQWRVIMTACATALFCAGLATLHLGAARWGEWLSLMPSFMEHVASNQMKAFEPLKLGVFYVLQMSLGTSSQVAMAVQLTLSLVIVAVTVLMFRARDAVREDLRIAWLLSATLMVLPHVFTYDMVLVILPVLILLNHTWNDEKLIGTAAISVFVVLAPFLQGVVSASHQPFACVSVMILLAYTAILYRLQPSE